MLLNFFGRYFYLILYFGEFSVSKKYHIEYIIGIPKNNRLNKLLEETMNKAKEQFKETTRIFHEGAKN